MSNFYTTRSGITSLVAVMVMSVALSLGVGIFQLLYAEMLLSRDQAHSVIAEYAAHAGIECALYNAFAGALDASSGAPTMVCNGDNFTGKNEGPNTWRFAGKGDEYMVGESCVSIVYEKRSLDAATEGWIFTSRAQYPCGSSNAVERGVQTMLKRGM